MRAQITLTVNEAKGIIAKGVAKLPEVQNALKFGKIFIKAGTTTPAVCEELIGRKLRLSGRRSIDLSLGRPVGLLPSFRKIITEEDALPLLADVSCFVIGRGGIFGAEGATTMILEGSQENVERVMKIIMSIKGAGVSGVEESLPSCEVPSPICKIHRTCVYRKMKKEYQSS